MSGIKECIDEATFVTDRLSLVDPPPCSNDKTVDPAWSPSLSASLYRLDKWGPPYFTVNSSGNISIRPHGNDTVLPEEIDLFEVMKKVSAPKTDGGLGFKPPLIVRFPEVLKHRLESLQSAFGSAVRSLGYTAHYQGVYPVKCNQDRFVVEDMVRFGSPFKLGLEVCSKTELLLAISGLCKGNPDGLLVCNGFKDAEYIALALIGRKLAINTVVVFEQEEELDIAIQLSKKLDIRPVFGVRAKLRTKHSGYYGSTSGEKGKFGLTAMQILHIVGKLERAGMLDCLQLLHFHVGSQIPTASCIDDGVTEAAQIYCELVRLGAHMKVIDVGGGLGVDYDGSKSSNSDVSVSYTLEEYALTVVGTLKSICDVKSVKHPVICSESGRATVSHYSVLIFEAFPPNYSSAMFGLTEPDTTSPIGPDGLKEGIHVDNVAEATRGETDFCILDADRLKRRCIDEFKLGFLSIEQLAAADGFYDLAAKATNGGVPKGPQIYRINLSIFTSIPNYWGTGHLFPIIPIHRLGEKPDVEGVLSDITCDSDGKIGTYIGGKSTLPLHGLAEPKKGGEGGGRYFLGLFLGGAYEEAQGGLHNMFGGPNVVHVESRARTPHGFVVTRALPGASSGDLLRVMRHEPDAAIVLLRNRARVLGFDGAANGVGLEHGLDRFIHSWPYHVDTASCGLEPVTANGFY